MPRAGDAAIRLMAYLRVRGLRWSLGLVFLWFGGLKLAGASPVEGLVAATVPWLPAGPLVLAVGAWEVAIGLLFLWGRWIRFTLALFSLQMAGTFLLLVTQPQLAFQSDNPLLLTTLGEFVVKNLVLVAAGLSIGGQALAKERRDGGRPGASHPSRPGRGSGRDASRSS